jgi:hypothetical protein
MGLTTSDLVLWCISLFLELIVCVLAFRRRLYRSLPVFTGYILAVFVRGLLMYWVYHRMGYTSRPAFYSFWGTQAVLLALRGASIGELAWTASRSYFGFRVIMKWLIASVSLLFLIEVSWLAIKTPAQLPAFVLALERNLELTAALVLLVLLFLTFHYHIMLSAAQKFIALGLFLYSLVQVVNNAISNEWLRPYFHWWEVVRLVSFHVALVIWLFALRKPLVEQTIPAPPADLDPTREFVRQGTAVMNDLSERMSRFRKKL